MSAILENLSETTRNAVISAGHTRTFSANAEVFTEGEKAEFLPIVVSGRIKMVRYPEPGKEIIIGTFGAGEIFAIPPALDGKRFPATAIATEESRLLLLPRDKFVKLKAAYPDLSDLIVEKMCGLLRDHTETINILATSSAEQRVAAILLKLAGEIPPNSVKKIAHRRQDIAEMSGLTTESTIRAIRRLADKGMFQILRGKIHISDTKALKEFLR